MKIKFLASVLVLLATASCWAAPPMLAVAAAGDGTVNLYGLRGQLVKSIPVGKRPGEMCLAPNGKTLFVSNATEKNIAVIDLDSKTVVASLTAPTLKSPDGCAVSSDSKKLYSIDQEGNALFVFSTDSRQMLARIDVGKEPRRAIVSPDGRRVLVSNAHSNTLSVIDTATNAVVKTVPTGLEPRNMAYSPDGKTLAVAIIDDDCASFFKADTLEFKQQVAAAQSPQRLEFSPDGQTLYVLGKITDLVAVMSVGEASRLATTIPLTHGVAGIGGTWGMAKSPDGKSLYVSNLGDGTVSVIDLRLMKISNGFSAGKTPMAVVYIPATVSATAAMPASARADHYRSLAQQAMDAVKKNDMAAADKLVRTLEQEYDENEGALRKSSPDVWGQIDEAMDDFIHPIMRSGGVAPNAAALNTVYQNFLTKLKLIN